VKIVVPHWLAEKLAEQHGSLPAAREAWRGLDIRDDYWDRLALESQNRINVKLRQRPWPWDSES
jgi:hypothetical protein